MKKNELIISISCVSVCIIGIVMLGFIEEPQNDISNDIENDVIIEEVNNTEIIENDNVKIDENLTIDNCEDLSTILKIKDESDSRIKEFANNYKGQKIEFDGNISALTNHGSYKTRYDILIYGGNYNENSVSGPSFKFEDVNTTDLGINDLYLPEFVGVGNNVHIIAEVKEYDDNTGIFKLNPVSIQTR